MSDLSWHDYFMAFAGLASKKSKDPDYQVGACIVNKDNVIVGVGYNCMPKDLDVFPWTKKKHSKNDLDNKHLYVCHAELNAIVNKNSADLKDCRIYVTLCPCNECAKLLIQSGIGEVFYLSDQNALTPEAEASKEMMDKAGVEFIQLNPPQNQLIDFSKFL